VDARRKDDAQSNKDDNGKHGLWAERKGMNIDGLVRWARGLKSKLRGIAFTVPSSYRLFTDWYDRNN
jgi:hypothetical protein